MEFFVLILKAIELNKPQWFIAHRDITIARQLLKQFMFDTNNDPNPSFSYRSTKVIDDIRVITMYNDTILNNTPINVRKGHWVDEYFRLSDILKYTETQFSDMKRVVAIVKQMKTSPI